MTPDASAPKRSEESGGHTPGPDLGAGSTIDEGKRGLAHFQGAMPKVSKKMCLSPVP